MNRKCVTTEGGFCLLDITANTVPYKLKEKNCSKSMMQKIMEIEQTFFPPSLTLLENLDYSRLHWLIYALFYLFGYLFLFTLLLYQERLLPKCIVFFIACLKVSESVLINAVLKIFSSVKYQCLNYCNMNQY